METARNGPLVLAKFLRAATSDLRYTMMPPAATPSENDRVVRANAIESIDAVADALEEQAKAPAPDPAGGTDAAS